MVDKQESLQQCYESGIDATSVSDVTSDSLGPKPGPYTSSMFGESQLGEPLVAQHLVLDFTPMDEIDNDIAQRKCCDFWDYVKSRTDLRGMLVLPAGASKPIIDFKDEEMITKVTEDSVVTGSGLKPTRMRKHAKTAVSMLEVVEGKGLIDRIFEAKLHQTNCSLGSREYLGDESYKPVPTNTTTCTCSTICKWCRNVPKSKALESGVSSPGVQVLCQKLQAWDADHPKSMNPPGHAPELTHCIIQRKVII